MKKTDWPYILLMVMILILFATFIAKTESQTLQYRTYLPMIENYTNPTVNPSFEEPQTHHTTYLWEWDDTEVKLIYPNEVLVPYGWNAWVVKGAKCGYDQTPPEQRYTDMPEIKTLYRHDQYLPPDPYRIEVGDRSVQLFTFWKCHMAGVFQTDVVLDPGTYQFCFRAHSWFSECSWYPHGLPLWKDCKTYIDHPLIWLDLQAGIGFDNTNKYYSFNIKWGERVRSYNVWADVCSGKVKISEKTPVSLWIMSHSNWPLKHCDSYFNRTWLVRE